MTNEQLKQKYLDLLRNRKGASTGTIGFWSPKDKEDFIKEIDIEIEKIENIFEKNFENINKE